VRFAYSRTQTLLDFSERGLGTTLRLAHLASACGGREAGMLPIELANRLLVLHTLNVNVLNVPCTLLEAMQIHSNSS